MPTDLGPFLKRLLDKSEPQIKAALRVRLSHDFEIAEEVRGVHLLENVAVQVDFMLRAKTHLVEKGFTDEPIPLEVKQFSDLENKSIRAAWQCITYAQSQFDGKRPPFVLLFPPIRLFMKRGQECEHAISLHSLLPKANVGSLSFRRNDEWQIYFAQDRYFSETQGLGPYSQNAFKRHVGYWK